MSHVRGLHLFMRPKRIQTTPDCDDLHVCYRYARLNVRYVCTLECTLCMHARYVCTLVRYVCTLECTVHMDAVYVRYV
jgi:hypothetical protein